MSQIHPSHLPGGYRASHRTQKTLTERATRRVVGRRVGFVSTRLAGTDGVSLETRKWASVLEQMGHHCFYFAGQLDTPPEQNYLVAEAFFGHPDIELVQSIAFTQPVRPPAITRRIAAIKDYLKLHLARFVQHFELDVLIVENALTIPMHIPLGLALTEYIAETAMPTIAHHHDFYWERQRFLNNCVEDYLAMSFPPRLPSIQHVVINSQGAQQLSLRTGSASLLIPNVMDFDRPPPAPGVRVEQLRAELGLAANERLALQPTRIVQRKGIEHAIELLSRLSGTTRLVISHPSGDEGDEYLQRICNYAAMLGVKIDLVAQMIGEQPGRNAEGQMLYALGDIYALADIVTYPSIIEGFGNAFLEAVYFRRPLVVNNYPIFDTDIKPKGFQVIEFQDYITDDTVRRTQAVLDDVHLAQAMADHNYRLARKFYSYTVLAEHLHTLLSHVSPRHTTQPLVSK